MPNTPMRLTIKTTDERRMDYSGYNGLSREELEIELAGDILAFIDRVSTREPLLPLKIYEGCG
jgi:hypothetical protein